MGYKLALGIGVWFQYLAIGLLAAVFAYFALLSARYGTIEGDVCLYGVFQIMWRAYLAPWLTAYLVLSLARLLVLLAHRRLSGSGPAIDLPAIRKFAPRILVAAASFAITFIITMGLNAL